MSDSESDRSNPNVFSFQNNMVVNARGPYTNVSNFSFRAPMSSTMYNMPRNFERQRYAESVSDQRSIYYRRERSPMSVHSAYHVRPLNRPQYYSGMSTQQSVFNGRGGSPMSIRSIDSNATVSAADIAFAFKNMKFNNFDSRVIRAAYQKWIRRRKRRRNMRVFRKGSRNRSDDSGEQGSDSSISSDDCRSVRTSYTQHISSNQMPRVQYSRDNMFNDYTESIKENTLKTIMPIGRTNFKERKENNNFNSSTFDNNIHTIPTQKERFRTGFVLPYQRFNNSTTSISFQKNTEKLLKNNDRRKNQNEKCVEDKNYVSESEEEIFPERSNKEKNISDIGILRKRRLESEDELSLPDRKKSKRTSPNITSKSNTKMPSKTFHNTSNNTLNNNMSNFNTFNFAKPTLPVRKSRSKVQENVITKSNPPPTESVNPIGSFTSPKEPEISQSPVKQSELSENTDVSMRPSFIKRKLFTQNLDVAEKSNISSDSVSSPKDVYSGLEKEKNKARKLVPTQSCMNREVQGDNNLLDLIHKIVPPDCINKTHQTSINLTKSHLQNGHSSQKEDDDTWDVTSVMSICNEENVSDTFTDEDIFGCADKKSDKSKKSSKTSRNNSNRKSKAITNTADNVNYGLKQKAIDKIQNDKTETISSATNRRRTRSYTNLTPKATNEKEDSKTTVRDCKIVINNRDKDKCNKIKDTNHCSNTKNNQSFKPNTIKITENISLAKDTTTVNKKTNITKHCPNTKNSHSTKPKTIKSVENVNPAKDCKTVTNTEKNKKNDKSNHCEITKNNRSTKLNTVKGKENINLAKESTTIVNNIEKAKNKKTNDSNHCPNTKDNCNIKPNTIKIIDNASIAKDIAINNINKDNIKNAHHLPKVGNSIYMKQKATKDTEEKANLPQKVSTAKSQGALKPVTVQKTNICANITKNSARTFWDTDSESDADYRVNTPRSRVRAGQLTANIAVDKSTPEFKHPLPITPLTRHRMRAAETSQWLNNTKNNNFLNNTSDCARKFNISSLSLRSHRTSNKRKMCCM